MSVVLGYIMPDCVVLASDGRMSLRLPDGSLKPVGEFSKKVFLINCGTAAMGITGSNAMTQILCREFESTAFCFDELVDRVRRLAQETIAELRKTLTVEGCAIMLASCQGKPRLVDLRNGDDFTPIESPIHTILVIGNKDAIPAVADTFDKLMCKLAPTFQNVGPLAEFAIRQSAENFSHTINANTWSIVLTESEGFVTHRPIPAEEQTFGDGCEADGSSRVSVHPSAVQLSGDGKSNFIDPSKSGVLMKGAVPPMWSGAFTYTATTTSITISWNSLTLYRADGTVTNIGSGSQAITGLTAGTTYYFYPYWDEVSSSVKFVQSSSLAQAVTPIVGAEMSSTGYVSTATSLTLPTTVSVEAWFHATADGIIASFDTPQTGAVTTASMILNRVSGAVTWNPGTSAITSPLATYNDGQWHHVVGTYDGTTAILFVDGVLVASGAVSPHTSFTGWWRPAGAADITKYVAHSAVYTGIVLSATQVANHFTAMKNGGVATYSAGVLADGATYYWKLTETIGTTATDSADSNTGTYQAAVTLNQSQGIVSSTGSPAYAWGGPLIEAQQSQALQSHVPLSAGTLQAATPASGTGGGVSGGATGSGGGGSKGLL